MDIFKSFKQRVLKMQLSRFEQIAMDLFKYQAKNNSVYSKYIKFLGKNPGEVQKIHQIPFLPVEFFKNYQVVTGNWDPDTYFKSSGTTGMKTSIHYIRDLNFYFDLSKQIFTDIYGPINKYQILALLPSYLEREHSSLIAMVNSFIDQANKGSGFYMRNYEDLFEAIKKQEKKTVIWGVTFALLELAEKYPSDLRDVLIIETGGMKGRGKEITREELCEYLKQRLGVKEVHTEYGMTEIMSQAYGVNGKFKNSSTMRVLIREINDPFEFVGDGRTGGINIIDLANIHSCAFIETKDLGRQNDDGTFEVLGRFDNSDLRGCNLLF